MSTIIIAIEYLEPAFKKTIECIKQTDLPYIIVQRKPEGVGSLAEAINRGVRQCGRFKKILVVTNITFDNSILKLITNLDCFEGVAISPQFNSDHSHAQPDSKKDVRCVPFFEFTCVLAYADVLARYPLDESMPYWGHDFDWGYRIREAGYKIGVDHSVQIDHTYIRNSVSHPVTKRRFALRKLTDHQTTQVLIKKYGAGWRNKICTL